MNISTHTYSIFCFYFYFRKTSKSATSTAKGKKVKEQQPADQQTKTKSKSKKGDSKFEDGKQNDSPVSKVTKRGKKSPAKELPKSKRSSKKVVPPPSAKEPTKKRGRPRKQVCPIQSPLFLYIGCRLECAHVIRECIRYFPYPFEENQCQFLITNILN